MRVTEFCITSERIAGDWVRTGDCRDHSVFLRPTFRDDAPPSNATPWEVSAIFERATEVWVVWKREVTHA